ncbi:MAG TPA: glycoside hydrolase family 3 C-terminal domain-containing protein [Clostridia bacterium]|nr:glycoside hydrolase family 3 C-terminal domain-containing protein [Clostridia bacterium]
MNNIKYDFKRRAKELVSKMTLAEKTAQMQYESEAIDRLSIPAYNWWNEALHGAARSGTATVFPQSIACAASFNDKLMKKVGNAISDEVRAKYNQYSKFNGTEIYQGLTCWSPNINIFRDPRWGRGHETYGEDPLLTAKMGTAYIKGMQGNDKAYKKVDCTLKHYAVHSGPESLRHSFDAFVSEKDLYETYLFAFKYCIKHSNPSAVMGAYNRVYGEPCCGSSYLLEKILRKEFGFKGYVVSDCGAICDFHKYHKVTENEAESAALAVKSGCDLNCGDTYKWLKVAVAEGMLTEEDITKSSERLFEARFRLGMFDKECRYNQIPYSVICSKKHKKLNLDMARESIVLLKNSGILPLSNDKKIAIIGPNADDLSVLLANYNGTADDYYTPLRGIRKLCKNGVIYARGCHVTEDESTWRYGEHPMREAIIAAKHSDVVIMCMGINPQIEGEEALHKGFKGDRDSIEMPLIQQKLFKEIRKTNKPIIFVNISGSCIDLSLPDKEADAVIQCFYPGALGGIALADIIFGRVSPSGRLPVTFYKDTTDLPDFEDYSMENRTYRFFKGKPVYSFGFGLSYADVEEKWIDENTVEISNKSDIDTDYSVLKFQKKPDMKLLDFKKVKLKGNSKKIVIFS